MLKQAKGFVMGVIMGTVIATSMVVFAAPIEKAITVSYNNIKLYIDGKLIIPKDGNGNSVEPFIYNGTTYLPVRAVGEALGKSVDWDGATQSVYVGKNPNSNQPSVWLRDMDYFSKNGSWNKYDTVNDTKDNAGNIYENKGIYCYNYEGGEITYLLNAKYSEFVGTIALHYDRRSTDNQYSINIYGDDKLLYTSPVMTKEVLAVDFKVDVSGVLKLKIEQVKHSYYGDNKAIGILNAGFIE